MRILIVEDHPMFASAVRDELKSLAPDVVISIAGSLEEGVRLASASAYTLVLADLAIPGAHGLSGIKRLRACSPARVAVITASDDPAVVRALFAERCVGFICKASPADQIQESLYLLLAGAAVFPDYVYATRSAPRPSSMLLTPRELDVLKLVAAGLQNKEIARDLALGPATVKTHVKNIYSKLGVKTRMAALSKSDQLGLFARAPNP